MRDDGSRRGRERRQTPSERRDEPKRPRSLDGDARSRSLRRRRRRRAARRRDRPDQEKKEKRDEKGEQNQTNIYYLRYLYHLHNVARNDARRQTTQRHYTPRRGERLAVLPRKKKKRTFFALLIRYNRENASFLALRRRCLATFSDSRPSLLLNRRRRVFRVQPFNRFIPPAPFADDSPRRFAIGERSTAKISLQQAFFALFIEYRVLKKRFFFENRRKTRAVERFFAISGRERSIKL